MKEIRRFKPSMVSRRFSVTAGFYRTCVIDGLLEHPPAEHVRRPTVPAKSPTWDSPPPAVRSAAHAASQSPNQCDFAMAAIAGLLSSRIFEVIGADVACPG
jgi:integrase/recombinase XerD